MQTKPSAASIPEVSHHQAELGGTTLHYVSAGEEGRPVLLVHGFPETWWAFHRLIPLLARSHRVFAVDLRGFGDSAAAAEDFGTAGAAEDLHRLIDHLGVGPVHLTGQDVGGPVAFRLAASRPGDLASYAAIETGLPGFGWEKLADVTNGGIWHVGFMAAPGIPEMLLAGNEREFLARYAFPSFSARPEAFTEADIEEFARSFSRPGGFSGAAAIYRSLLAEGDEIVEIVGGGKLRMPVLAVGARSGAFTGRTMGQVAEEVKEVLLEGVGHYAAMEQPERLAEALLGFWSEVDA